VHFLFGQRTLVRGFTTEQLRIEVGAAFAGRGLRLGRRRRKGGGQDERDRNDAGTGHDLLQRRRRSNACSRSQSILK